MTFDYHYALLAIATCMGLYNYYLYIKGTFAGKFKPHMFSWGIWSLLCFITFAAQLSKDAGPGMYQTAVMATGTGVIMYIAYFKGDKNYTRSDWLALVTAFLAIPLWIITKDPLWSILLVTGIDFVATWPTVRKAWHKPHQESSKAFFNFGIICGLGFFAISNLTLTTGLYQGTISLLNFSIAAMITLRRRAIPAEAT